MSREYRPMTRTSQCWPAKSGPLLGGHVEPTMVGAGLPLHRTRHPVRKEADVLRDSGVLIVVSSPWTQNQLDAGRDEQNPAPWVPLSSTVHPGGSWGGAQWG